MPDGFRVEVKGLNEVCARLRDAAPKIARRVLRKALTAGGEVLGLAVQARTPVKRGLMKESVGLLVRVPKQGCEGAAIVGFGNQGFKARMVEFGHQAGKVTAEETYRDKRGKKRTRRTLAHRVPAHPFIRPASDSVRQAAADAAVTAAKAEMDRIGVSPSVSDEGPEETKRNV